MRTTIKLDDELLREAKQVARETDRTLGQLIEDALREVIARRRAFAERKKAPMPTFKGTGLQPGVDLDDSAALLEIMERADAPP